MIDIKHCVSEVDIKTEIELEIKDFHCCEINTESNTEEIYVADKIVKKADDLANNDVCQSNNTGSTQSTPLRTYAGKQTAPTTTSYDYKWVTKEKCSTDVGKTLCTTCGALIRNESMEQHKNKHLGTKFVYAFIF